MKRVALALFLLLATAGCGSGMNLSGTKLTLTAINPNVGRAVFHLDCGPNGGDLSDPSSACSALGHDPKLVTSPQPFTCLGGPSSWFDMTISGRLAGKPVHQKFSTCWTPQMATLGKLGLARSLESHVLRRRHGIVRPGSPHVFAPGALRPGDLIVCRILKRRLELGIPAHFGSIGSVGAGGTAIGSVTLSGRRHGDDSISASCRRGDA